MRKRLRKKLHLGACVEWGVPMAVRRRHPDDFDDFLDECIAQAIEAHGLAFGGGGHDDRLTGVIEVAARPTPSRHAPSTSVTGWARAWMLSSVKQYVVGPLVDLWHGPFDDLETIDERLPDG